MGEWIKKTSILLILQSAFYISAPVQAAVKPEKIAHCNACHQRTDLLMPNLAGQSARYLAKQLHDFKPGQGRPSAVMTPLAADLSDEDIVELVAFYAQLPLPPQQPSSQDSRRGRQLYREGDLNKQISACIICHGPHGTGNVSAGFPVLSGQKIAYTIQQLYAFKHKKRCNDSAAIMRSICTSMDDEDIQALAVYIAGLH